MDPLPPCFTPVKYETIHWFPSDTGKLLVDDSQTMKYTYLQFFERFRCINIVVLTLYPDYDRPKREGDGGGTLTVTVPSRLQDRSWTSPGLESQSRPVPSTEGLLVPGVSSVRLGSRVYVNLRLSSLVLDLVPVLSRSATEHY